MQTDPMGELKTTFFQECTELMEELLDQLENLSAGHDDAETINTIFRAVHSIKGGAGAFGFSDLVTFAHSFENVLDELRSGKLTADPAVCAVCVRSADVLGDLIEATQTGATLDRAVVDSAVFRLEKLIGTQVVGDAALPVFAAQAISLPGLGLVEPVPALKAAQPLDVEFTPLAELYASGNDPIPALSVLTSSQQDTLSCKVDKVPLLDALVPEDSYLTWQFQSPADVGKQDLLELFEFLEGLCTLTIVDEVAPETCAAAPKKVPIAAVKQVVKLQNSTVRVDLERIDRLVNLVGELVINQSMLSQNIASLTLNTGPEIDAGLEDFMRLTRDIQDSVMLIRAQPVKSLFQRMSRIVRDTAAARGKFAEFVAVGEATEIDKTVLEQLSEPLTHLIRNAIDHGLEPPKARSDAAKSEAGRITLAASHKSGRVILEISDDGAGLDRKMIRAKAVEKGIIGEDDVLTAAEIDALLFVPGFSTSAEVSDLSGRGVGMDVVKRAIQALGGTVSIRSEFGSGTCFTISLPLTLAILDSMIVTASEQTFILPLSPITETLRWSDVRAVSFRKMAEAITIRGDVVPLIRLNRSLGLPEAEVASKGGAVLIVDNGDGLKYALYVDSIEEQRQVVIKGFQVGSGVCAGVSAATILGDGRVSFIIDPISLPQLAAIQQSPKTETAA